MSKTYKIGFLGFGTVAGGVYKHLTTNFSDMCAKFGAKFEIGKVCVRDINKPRAIDIEKSKLTENPYDIVDDPEIDIVCELMGGIEPAFELTMRAFKNGKIVVSANKAVISNKGKELLQEAKKHNVAYFFEASVAGGIPVIKALREGLIANSFPVIYGILNGTCNYILTRMESENASYAAIIKDARKLGYVEADESLDIDGIDAAHKISILAYLAHGVWIPLNKMLVRGIRGIRLEDMIWARDFDCRVKLIASVRKIPESGALFASVYPALLPLSDAVANVNDVFNAVSIEGDVVGRTIYIGRGAGQDATASAVIADIADAVRYLMGAPLIATKDDVPLKLARLHEVSGEFYLRIEVQDKVGVLASLASILACEQISIEQLQQRKHETAGRAWVVLTTHKTDEGSIKKVCAALKKAPFVYSEPFVLRIFSGK
ncbi:MAG: homoserine dehydrogenase [Opitutales bacterium]|nr:homoserine dehydrogenase [Opitutales bacterium]